MSQLLNEEDLSFIRRQTQAYMADPRMIFLGGSQTIDGGAHKTASSDFDILMIGTYIDKPLSLAVDHPTTGRHFDLILRDLETLAFDISAAQKNGKGTLLHLGAHSQISVDQDRKAEALRDSLRCCHARGPDPVEDYSLTEHCNLLARQADEMGTMRNRTARRLAALTLTHEIGIAALRARRHWVGKGKILGRFLLAAAQDFKQELEAAYVEAESGSAIHLNQMARRARHLPPAEIAPGTQPVPFYPPADREEAQNADQAFYAALRNKNALFRYLRSDDSPLRTGAQQLLRRKHDVAAKAVDPERIGRDSNEYFFGLARYTRQLLLEQALAAGVDPSGLSYCDQARLAVTRNPSTLDENLTRAMAGDPAAYLRQGAALLSILAPPADGLPARMAPASNRLNPKVFNLG